MPINNFNSPSTILRRKDAADWAALNPTLERGELVLERDTFYMKIGDGVTKYNALNYLPPFGPSPTIDASFVNDLAISDTFVVADQAAMLLLDVQTGDIAIRTDTGETFILQGTDPTVLGDWTVITPVAAPGGQWSAPTTYTFSGAAEVVLTNFNLMQGKKIWIELISVATSVTTGLQGELSVLAGGGGYQPSYSWNRHTGSGTVAALDAVAATGGLFLTRGTTFTASTFGINGDIFLDLTQGGVNYQPITWNFNYTNNIATLEGSRGWGRPNSSSSNFASMRLFPTAGTITGTVRVRSLSPT